MKCQSGAWAGAGCPQRQGTCALHPGKVGPMGVPQRGARLGHPGSAPKPSSPGAAQPPAGLGPAPHTAQAADCHREASARSHTDPAPGTQPPGLCSLPNQQHQVLPRSPTRFKPLTGDADAVHRLFVPTQIALSRQDVPGSRVTLRCCRGRARVPTAALAPASACSAETPARSPPGKREGHGAPVGRSYLVRAGWGPGGRRRARL